MRSAHEDRAVLVLTMTTPIPARPLTKREQLIYRAGYSSGFADRHDGQPANPEYSLTRYRSWLKLPENRLPEADHE